MVHSELARLGSVEHFAHLVLDDSDQGNVKIEAPRGAEEDCPNYLPVVQWHAEIWDGENDAVCGSGWDDARLFVNQPERTPYALIHCENKHVDYDACGRGETPGLSFDKDEFSEILFPYPSNGIEPKYRRCVHDISDLSLLFSKKSGYRARMIALMIALAQQDSNPFSEDWLWPKMYWGCRVLFELEPGFVKGAKRDKLDKLKNNGFKPSEEFGHLLNSLEEYTKAWTESSAKWKAATDVEGAKAIGTIINGHPEIRRRGGIGKLPSRLTRFCELLKEMLTFAEESRTRWGELGLSSDNAYGLRGAWLGEAFCDRYGEKTTLACDLSIWEKHFFVAKVVDVSKDPRPVTIKFLDVLLGMHFDTLGDKSLETLLEDSEDRVPLEIGEARQLLSVAIRVLREHFQVDRCERLEVLRKDRFKELDYISEDGHDVYERFAE